PLGILVLPLVRASSWARPRPLPAPRPRTGARGRIEARRNRKSDDVPERSTQHDPKRTSAWRGRRVTRAPLSRMGTLTRPPGPLMLSRQRGHLAPRLTEAPCADL